MNSQQSNLDVISNNLANVNTIGFKKSRAEFQDLLYQNERAAGAQQGNNAVVPNGIQVGHGSKLIATPKVFTDGEVVQTDGELDVAIMGTGFFEVQMPDGSRAFTRDGAFKKDKDGNIVNSNGLRYQNGFQPIPSDAKSTTISADGQFSCSTSGGVQSFTIQLVRFANPAGLESMGGNLFKATEASGEPESGNPGDATMGLGSLSQNHLEMSNVKVVEEMVNMIMAQRAYEINSKSVQSADEMMQMSNNLKR
jgi:flagellar basal-body rod protein FlgG